MLYGIKMVVFGENDGGSYRNDVWQLELTTNTWSQISPTGGPTARRFHTAVLYGTKMVVFGGYSHIHYYKYFYCRIPMIFLKC